MIATSSKLEIHGHRGCRGLMPENTIPAFIKAIELGATTLEMDVVITADNRVLVSHEPYMSHLICKTPDGKPIREEDEQSHNIYKMTAAEAQAYDCGETFVKDFPDQEKMSVSKPLLSEVIDAIESYTSKNKLAPVWYNIETKCTPENDHIFHPDPEVFSDLLMLDINFKNISSRVIIQSFDVRTLQHLKNKNVPVLFSLVVENLKGVEYNLNALGFIPDIYCPHFKLLTAHNMHYLRTKNIRIVPWTVNDEKDMQRLLLSGVDGIITDYPDRLKKISS